MSPDPWDRYSHIRACALCHSRKVKCDRMSPCSNCVKSGVDCVPSKPGPPKRRKPPRQDLQKRLEMCEQLLSRYSASHGAQNNEKGPENSPAELLECLVLDDSGNSQFTDSMLWAKVQDEVRAMREIVDQEIQDTPSVSSTPESTPQTDLPLFPEQTPGLNVESFQPPPAHVLCLWQSFLDRVHPLTKVIHAPSLQPIVVEAAINLPSVPKNVQALLISIYLLGVVSMTDAECHKKLRESKKSAIDRYAQILNSSFNRIGLLKGYDVTVLQALVFYMIFLCYRYQHQSAWILNGTIMRIAQKLGIHRDGENLGLSPFETEMRRRIWWQIVIFDYYCALMSGLSQSVLPEGSDTKNPSSANDSDLFPEMAPTPAREGTTEMVFVLYTLSLHRMMSKTRRLVSIITQKIRPSQNDLPTGPEDHVKLLSEFGAASDLLLQTYGDAGAGPIHQFTIKSRSFFMARMTRMFDFYEKPQPSDHVVENAGENDVLMEVAIFMSERCIDWYEAVLPSNCFSWFARLNLRVDILVYLAGQLSSHASGPTAERGWRIFDHLYRLNEDLFDLTEKRHLVLARYIIRAWSGWSNTNPAMANAPAPTYISRLNQLLTNTTGSTISSLETATPLWPNSFNHGSFTSESATSEGWEGLFDSIDVENVDWQTYDGSRYLEG